MGGGVLSGLAIGLAVSALVLAAVSLNTPLPERPAMAVVPDETPPSAPDDAPQDDPAAAPAAPDPIEAPPAGSGDAPGPDMPTAPERPEPSDAETDAETEAADTAVETERAADTAVETERAAGTPVDAETPGGLATARTDGAARIALPQIDASPETPAPAMPPQVGAASQDPPVAGTASAPAPRIAAAPSPMPGALPVAPSPRFIAGTEAAPSGTAPRRLALPQVSEAPATADTAPAPPPAVAPATPAAETGETDAPRRPTLPQVVDAPDALSAPAQAAPQVAASDAGAATLPRRIAVPQVPAEGTPAQPEATTGRGLPQIAAAPPTVPEPAAQPAPDAAPDPVPEGPPNALRDNAVAFETPADGALMAIVLIDDPDSPLDPAVLTRFTFPVSFAIDPLRPDASARAAELREAGFEVVILAGGLIPEAAAPADVETALASARETMPQAVAVMDTPDSRIQSDRAVLDAAVAALVESGHGLLAFPRGLNAAEQSARRADLPAATFFRQLDDEDQRATVITRYLGRAAFAAGQDGGVVVVGRTQPDTVTALFSWALGSRTEQVTLAPVSAVLGRLSE